MLTLKGTLVGVNSTEKMVTQKGNRYRVLEVFQQNNGHSALFKVRDYDVKKEYPVNKPIELNVICSAFVNKQGGASLSYTSITK